MARIFIISNRVAVPNSGNHPGGLEVVLKATLRKHPCVWLGWSGKVNEKPRTETIVSGDNEYIVTDLKPEDFDEYYNGFANRVLWPIFHYRLDLAEFSRRDLSGYLREIYQMPDVRKTCRLDHIKTHYYWSQTTVNPHRIVPVGPDLEPFLELPHGRG